MTWKRLSGLNCHGPYNGAQNVESVDRRLDEIGGISGCKEHCLATYGCEAVCVTMVSVEWEEEWPFKVCGLRRDVWAEHCSGDTHHDTWVLEQPSPPPPPPRVPITRMSPAQRARQLNARFRDAKPSVNLEEAGLVTHQFDRLEMKGAPWKACNEHCENELAGSSLTGRLSTFIMYSRLRNRPDRVAVPLVSNTGGVIARPGDGIQIACLFGIDGATVGLNGGENGAGCPNAWCEPYGPREANGYCGFWGAPPDRAWKPENLDRLLELHEKDGDQYRVPGYHSGYNEAIVDGYSWNDHMPNTIEAFFELEGPGVGSEADAGRGQAGYARDAHSHFLREYELTENEVPLLRFDPSRWDAPFRAFSMSPVENLNDRFQMDPYDKWPVDGSLAWAGVLIHCIDGYEVHTEPWKPAHTEMSASLIFADQRVPGNGMPIFTCQDGGLIFRPQVTRLICGNGMDSGGTCHSFCDAATDLGNVGGYQNPGDGCGMSWRPKDFGMYLKRVAAWQKLNSRTQYNEIIVEGDGPKSHWTGNLPDTIEAFFQLKGNELGNIRGHHERFLKAYGLSKDTHPLVVLDPGEWETPFSAA